MTAEYLNIGKNTVYMIAKQKSGREKCQDDFKKSVLTGHGALCTILMTHHGERENVCKN